MNLAVTFRRADISLWWIHCLCFHKNVLYILTFSKFVPKYLMCLLKVLFVGLCKYSQVVCIDIVKFNFVNLVKLNFLLCYYYYTVSQICRFHFFLYSSNTFLLFLCNGIGRVFQLHADGSVAVISCKISMFHAKNNKLEADIVQITFYR